MENEKLKEELPEEEVPETEETTEEAAEAADEVTEAEAAETAETEEAEEDAAPEETPVTVPRPLWQRVGALVALVLFIALILMYYVNIARGGR